MPRTELVTRVVDGDTFEATGSIPRFRLLGVNAPKMYERNGRIARQLLRALIEGRWASIRIAKRNKRGVWADVTADDGRSVNEVMKTALQLQEQHQPA